MTYDITGLCRDHSFETAEEICRRCGGEYCELCVLYPMGAAKPLCKECAMAAGGVRSHVSRPQLPKREIKARVKAFEERRAARSQRRADPSLSISDPLLTDRHHRPEAGSEPTPAPVPVTVPDDLASREAEPARTPPPPSAPAHAPADGVAPPIDWSQPFG
ncbi:MAG: hypothetical protein R2695_19170 [Acidimicrobiales bacterium]